MLFPFPRRLTTLPLLLSLSASLNGWMSFILSVSAVRSSAGRQRSSPAPRLCLSLPSAMITPVRFSSRIRTPPPSAVYSLIILTVKVCVRSPWSFPLAASVPGAAILLRTAGSSIFSPIPPMSGRYAGQAAARITIPAALPPPGTSCLSRAIMSRS